MGITGSLPELDPSIRNIKEINKGVSQVPYKIPSNCKLQSVNLNGNSIRNLPSKMTRLTSLSLAKNGLATIPKEMIDAISTYSSLEFLDLSYNNLEELPSQFSALSNLKTAILFGNKLKQYEYSSIPIETIDLGKNSFTEFPKFNSKLVNLSMDSNKLTEIHAKLNNLIKLSLQNNFIEIITPDTYFRTLETLDLSYNLLREIPNLMKQTPRLRRIDLSHNYIEKIPELPRSLSVLLMADNSLTELPQDFSNLPYIVHIDLSMNKIKTVPQLPLSIQIFDVSNNLVEEIGDSETPDLVEFYVHHNKLRAIPNLKSNQILDYNLKCNKIVSIDASAFDSDISTLDLSFNLIEEVPEELFTLQNLNDLNLSHNKLTTLPPKIAESEIIFLNLSSNNIQNLPDLPHTLEYLHMSDCNITELPSTIAALTDLVFLSCPNNKISSIQIISNLIGLNLSNNKIKLIPELPDTLKHLNLSMNQITNIPLAFPTELTDLDLSYNSISSIPENLVIKSLKTLNISGNRSLNGNINIQNFQNLEHLNISDASIRMIGDATKIKTITSSNAMIKNGLLVNNTSSACFISSRGRFSALSDTPYVNMSTVAEISVFGIIHAQEDLERTLELKQELNTLFLSNREEFDGDILDSITEHASERIYSANNYKKSSITLAVLHGSLLTISQNGFIRCCIIYRDGKVQYTEANNAVKSNSIEPFLVRDNLADLRILGRKRVYGKPDSFNTESLFLQNAKFIVIGSENVFNDLPIETLSSLGKSIDSPSVLAHCLFNNVFDYNRNSNSSILVVSA